MAGLEPDLRNVRAFLAVVDEGSFTGAGRRLHLSQQGLTDRIHRLEQHLGARLFTRTTRRVELSPLGAELLADARALVEEADGRWGRMVARAARPPSRLTLGVERVARVRRTAPPRGGLGRGGGRHGARRPGAPDGRAPRPRGGRDPRRRRGAGTARDARARRRRRPRGDGRPHDRRVAPARRRRQRLAPRPRRDADPPVAPRDQPGHVRRRRGRLPGRRVRARGAGPAPRAGLPAAGDVRRPGVHRVVDAVPARVRPQGPGDRAAPRARARASRPASCSARGRTGRASTSCARCWRAACARSTWRSAVPTPGERRRSAHSR